MITPMRIVSKTRYMVLADSLENKVPEFLFKSLFLTREAA